jgi:hypothetical protein
LACLSSYKKWRVPVNAQRSPLSSVPLLDFLDLAKNGVFPDRNLFLPQPMGSGFSSASGSRLHFDRKKLQFR